VSRVFLDVRHYLSLRFYGSGPTDALAEGNVETAEASLIWADAQELARVNYSIEARPQMTESVVYQRGDRCHGSDLVIHTF
jgi:hypothetical protein